MTDSASIVTALAEGRALRRWREAGALAAPPEDLRRALGMRPGPRAWRTLFEALAGYLGAALLASALVCLVAYNWADLSKFVKLHGMQALLVGLGAGAAWFGPTRTAGRILLLLAAVAIGALFALIGQTYQTGADAWELFATWALLMLPLAFAGRWPPLWLGWLGVANVALYLLIDTDRPAWLRAFGDGGGFAILGLANAGCVAIAEALARRDPVLRARYALRLALLAAVVPLTIAAAFAVFDHDPAGVVVLFAWLAAGAVAGAYYRRRRLDVGALAALAASGIVVVACLLGRGVDELEIWGIGGSLIALVVVGLAVVSALWLLSLRRERPDVD